LSVLPVGFGSAAAGGYQIQRSLRFNSADTAYLNRTPASAGNLQTWTWSGWVKRSALGSGQQLFALFDYLASPLTNKQHGIRFLSGDTIEYWCYQDPSYNGRKITTQVFRDVSSWYHIVAVWDTPNATAANRMRLYVNGSEVTTFGTNTNPTQNSNGEINRAFLHTIGTFYDPDFGSPVNSFNGYLTEINFIDGQVPTTTTRTVNGVTETILTQLGEFNSSTGVWTPKAWDGTYGTNGFYLKFADNASTTTLGDDFSGNNNDWTTNNFSVTAGAGNDSLVDSPTSYGTDTGVGGEVRGNYCTLNPLDRGGGTITNGNLDITNSAASHLYARHTFQLPTSGKWYWEITGTWDANSRNGCGVIAASTAVNNYPWGTAQSFGWYLGSNTSNWYWSNNGSLVFNIVPSSPAVFQICYDADNGTIYAGINNTFYSSAGASTGNPSTLTNPTSSSVPTGLFPATGVYQSGSMVVNHGQRAFAYTAPSGFKALCTQNLPPVTIGATSTTQANDYFNTVLYTGTGSTGKSVSGVGFQTDFLWLKNRSNVSNNVLLDSVRGITNKILYSNLTNAEDTITVLNSVNSDGFIIDATGSGTNGSGEAYVAWNWKANGAGASNTNGSITSTVSANTTSGFSIVTYTGTGSNATVGHGLGVAPKMVIVKRRNSTGDWVIWNEVSFAANSANVLFLNSTDANFSAATNFNSTAPTSTVFSVGTNPAVNASGGTHVAYCFAPVAWYSAFGSYKGNASTDGPFIYTGFRPRFVMWKNTTTAGYNWEIIDTARDTYNVMLNVLGPNSSAAESTFAGPPYLDAVSNGFKIRTGSASSGYQNINNNNDTYIYAAFAESPFKYSLAR